MSSLCLLEAVVSRLLTSTPSAVTLRLLLTRLLSVNWRHANAVHIMTAERQASRLLKQQCHARLNGRIEVRDCHLELLQCRA